MEKKLGTVWDPITLKDGKLRIPDEILNEMKLQPGDTLHFETTPHNELIIKKTDTTYITLDIPTELYDDVRNEMKKYNYDTTVDQLINNALIAFLNKFKDDHTTNEKIEIPNDLRDKIQKEIKQLNLDMTIDQFIADAVQVKINKIKQQSN